MEKKIYQISSIAINDHNEYTDSVIISKLILTKNFRLHRHTYYELEYITDGHGTEKFNGTDTELSRGSLRLISPSDVHELIVDEDLTIVKICFDSAAISPSVFGRAKEFMGGAAFKVGEADKGAFDALFDAAVRLNSLFPEKMGFDVTAKSLLESIILTASEYMKRSAVESEPIKKGDIGAVLQYLHTGFDGKITLKSVAERFHFTKSYLSRRFHEVVGVTFVKYVKKLRLEYAAGLLLSTDAEITVISYEAGFSSPSSFANDFKAAFGVSPTKYREGRRKK